MSAVDIRVDLPSYSHSFTVSVQTQSNVLQVKQEIQRICPGQPRPEGQRLIYRGRLLKDDESLERLWTSEPRIVHLAVHPSAWSSVPPKVPDAASINMAPPSATFPASSAIPETPLPTSAEPVQERPMMTYLIHQHQKALASLSSSIPSPNELDFLNTWRMVARDGLEQYGWAWPAILDKEFPASSEGGLKYDSAVINGQPYLQLLNAGEPPTPRQEHALKVLTYTFTLLTMSLPATPPSRNTPQQPITVPPDVNRLLQQMGLPPLRAANGNIAPPIAEQNNPAVPQLREIPLRPLLAPLILLVFRTVLLLYFVAPARKPFFACVILGWMVYEVWRPIRNALQRVARPNQPQINNGGAPDAGNGGLNGVNPLGQPGAVPNVVAGGLDQHATAVLDTFAQMNIANEERILNSPAGTPAPEPSVGHKAVTFIGLLFSTLHPAVWNSRRVALRRREGTIRTEANMRNATPPEETDGAAPNSTPQSNRAVELRAQLRDRFSRQAPWIQRYMQRVVDEDWVDDAD